MLGAKNALSIRHATIATSLLIIVVLLIGNLWRSRLTDEAAVFPSQLIAMTDTQVNLQALRYHTTQVQQYLTDASLTGDRDSVTLAQQHAASARQLLSALPQTQRSDMDQLLTRQNAVGVAMVDAYLTNGLTAGNTLMKQADTGFDALSSQIADMVEQALTQQTAALQALEQHIKARQVELKFDDHFLLASYILIIIALLIWVMRRVTAPLKELEGQLRDLADHSQNLAFRLHSQHRDEFAYLAEVFNRFMANIDGLIGAVQSVTAQSQNKMSLLVSHSSTTLSSMDRVQTNTDAVASAITEMASTIQQIAHNLEQAKESTAFAKTQAQAGEQQVAQAVQLINQVASHIELSAEEITQLQRESAQIGDILAVIQNISAQTNLLALNAAIEAARAGEAGRGFAVVADEVRNLAKRTQNATIDIRQRIGTLQANTDHAVETMHTTSRVSQQAVEQANSAGQTLEGIVHTIERINELNVQIASAAEQQAQMADNTSHNVAAVSDIAHQTYELAQQSHQHSRDVNQSNQQIHQISGQFAVSQSAS